MSVSSVTFFTKNSIVCPLCKTGFKREVLRTGRGRIIADDLQYDLRRNYKSTPKYGIINPLIYHILVCPECYYATMVEDFLKLNPKFHENVKKAVSNRKKYAQMIFNEPVNFYEPRTLLSGAMSYFLAISTYSYFTKEFGPIIKKAICALRLSWLCRDLIKEKPSENYDKLFIYFRYIAMQLYEKSITLTSKGKEMYDNVSRLGPDVDTDYGYDGALYMMSLLGKEMGDFMQPKEKYKKFLYYRAALAKVFGFGRSSKEKPSNILENARQLHEEIGAEINRLKEIHPEIEA